MCRTAIPIFCIICSMLGAADNDDIGLNSPRTRWARGDIVAVAGDPRNIPTEAKFWAGDLCVQLRGVQPLGLVRPIWTGIETAVGFSDYYERQRPFLGWTIAVAMFGASDAQLRSPTEPGVFANSLRSVIKAMRQDRVIVVIATPMPCGDKASDNPLDARLDAYADAIRDVAAVDGVTLVDLRREAYAYLAEHNGANDPAISFSIIGPDKRWALTERGHAFVAERIARALGLAMQKVEPYIEPLPDALAGDGDISIVVHRLLRGSEVVIRFATDGKDPAGKEGRIYKEPIKLRKAKSISVLVTEDGKATSFNHVFSSAAMSPRSPDRFGNTSPGLRVEMWSLRSDSLPNFSTLGPPLVCGVCRAPDASFASDFSAPEPPDGPYVMRMQGYIDIQREGWYVFHLGSYFGSRLLLGTDTLINNDGPHPLAFQSKGVLLKEGRHAITILYSQGGGNIRILQLLYEGPGIRRSVVPDALFGFEIPVKPAGPAKP